MLCDECKKQAASRYIAYAMYNKHVVQILHLWFFFVANIE